MSRTDPGWKECQSSCQFGNGTIYGYDKWARGCRWRKNNRRRLWRSKILERFIIVTVSLVYCLLVTAARCGSKVGIVDDENTGVRALCYCCRFLGCEFFLWKCFGRRQRGYNNLFMLSNSRGGRRVTRSMAIVLFEIA
ncbi:hypothetical protein CPB84DRAFT_1772848 [Gymnopilus junonius]|uniref:Uncharacterized protein n=1 Tax=Gymnopilus junonius TaxID=109634 RepID=A0A9P5NUI2_GYMJU|nr:hypothetical protein CPB84DRAFT_1772848 [Gymnopilus junonius]